MISTELYYYYIFKIQFNLINIQPMEQQSQQAQVYSRQQYATKQFWDSRYKEKQSYFDWYAEFPQLKETFEEQYGLSPENSILMLGCGNSKLSQQMYQSGYHHILNVDISPAVIQQMKKVSQARGYTEMKWEVMDATNMAAIQDNTFDAIIDKGTLDALISGKNLDICSKMLIQSMRVLKRDGQFILITYGSPEGRKKLFELSIGLANYDYYVTKVDLSSISTLINLMRSNLGQKPLSSITKDTEAMKKSLMQFNLIKVLRRQRKNEKKYIIWPNYQKKEVLFNQNAESEQKCRSIKQQQKKYQQSNENQTKANQQKEKQQSPNSQQKINYSPKKQSFCYVYSIRPKFAIDLQNFLAASQIKQQIYSKTQNGDKRIDGDESLLVIGIHPINCKSQVSKAIKYLQLNKIANNPLIIYESIQNYTKSNSDIKIMISQAKQNVIPALSKSIFEVEVKCLGTEISEIQKLVKESCVQMIEQGGLSAHPCPKAYAFLGILMQKKQLKSRFNQFVGKYWYPTSKLQSYKEGVGKFLISTPPTLGQKYCIDICTSTIGTTIMAKQVKQGYLNYYDPRLLSLINLCTLTYCEGQLSHLIVQQFQSNFQTYTATNPTLFLVKEAIPFVLARLFSAL